MKPAPLFVALFLVACIPPAPPPPTVQPPPGVRDGVISMSLQHPGVCPKNIMFRWEDRKGLSTRGSIEPKQTLPLVSEKPPIWLFFGLPGQKDTKVWDLPSGEYVITVRDDCEGLDVVDQRYPAGSTARAKPATADK